MVLSGPCRNLHRGRRRLLVAVTLLLGTSCSPLPEPGDGDPATDLIAAFPLADVRRPTTFIDFGTAPSRPHLVRGWSHETAVLPGGDRQGGWSMGESAEVEFFVARAEEDLELSFLVAPVEPVADLSLSVNGTDVWAGPLEAAYLEYRAAVPASVLKPGENRLEIRHSPLSAPRQELKDARVVWDYLRFGAPGTPEPQPAGVDGDTLLLPFGTRVDYYLELTAGSALSIGRLEERSRARGELRVSWHPIDPPGAATSEDFRSGSSLLGGPLTPSARQRGRLSLFARSDGGGADPRAGLALTRPRIVTAAAGAASNPPQAAAPPAVPRPDGASRPAGPSRPNVILYMVDTLRADRLGCYGYPRDTSPFIDRFAAEGVLFESSQAQTPWTRASVASVLTGLWPQIHQAQGDLDALSEEAVTIGEHLQEIGYRTVAVIGNGNVNQYSGFAQGFDDFIYLQNVRPGQLLARSPDIHAAVLDWLDARPDDRPFFMWVLTIDPHLPYQAPEPFHSRFSDKPRDPSFGTAPRIGELKTQLEPVSPEIVGEMTNVYDAEVAANDASFGALIEELDRRGLYDASLTLFLADHGEELYEHGGWDHGSTLHSEVLETPLIIRPPHGAGGIRRREVVQHVDVVPTVIDLVGAPPLENVQGRSLVPLMSAGTDLAWDHQVVAHVDLRGWVATSLIDREWKLIVKHYGGVDAYPMLYDRLGDRAERTNLAPARPDLARFLAARLRAELRRVGTAQLAAAQLDPELLEKSRRQLKALGYLD